MRSSNRPSPSTRRLRTTDKKHVRAGRATADTRRPDAGGAEGRDPGPGSDTGTGQRERGSQRERNGGSGGDGRCRRTPGGGPEGNASRGADGFRGAEVREDSEETRARD